MSSIGNSSILDSFRVQTLSGKRIEVSSKYFVTRLRSLLTRSKGTERALELRWMSVSGNGEKAALVVSDGRVFVVNLKTGGVISRFVDKTEESQSVVTSIAALSVTDPLDVLMINWVEWATNDLLWMSNLQGNVCLMRDSEWENVLGEDWMQFGEGACVAARCGAEQHAKCLVLENQREWMKDLDGEDVLVNAYSLHSVEEVTPWEKFVRCIQAKEYGTALQLAKTRGFDEDLV